jgi:hypothetical protein
VILGDPSTFQNTKDHKLQEFRNILGYPENYLDLLEVIDNKKNSDLFPCIVSVVKSRRLPRAGYVARMG